MRGNGRAGKHGGGPFREEPQDLPVQLRGRGAAAARVGGERGRVAPRVSVGPAGRVQRRGLPSLRAQRGPLTCVACSRARTSRIRKGSKPRPAVQKKRAPAADPDWGSAGPAAAAMAAGTGRVTWPRTRARRSQGHVVRGAQGAVPALRGPRGWGWGGRRAGGARGPGAEGAQGRPLG